MRLLLDTHALIWWIGDDSRLGALAREAIASSENDVFASPASIWEIGIKQKKGLLEAPYDLVAIAKRSFIEMPITSSMRSRPAHCPGIMTTRSTGCWSRRRRPRG